MALPFFYINDYNSEKQLVLNEDTSKHIVQVLRMKEGEQINLTDGKGNLLLCEITEAHKKHCSIKITQTKNHKQKTKNRIVAISLLKNANRLEWFLEKATELGITEIIPLLCSRTEKQNFRTDRMQNILVSAMLQSQQVWLPVLHEPISFELLLRQEEIIAIQQKWIAHCINNEEKKLLPGLINKEQSQIILIGPEGDFTSDEIEFALQNNFQPVSLGETRLRTETAAVAAAVLLQIN